MREEPSVGKGLRFEGLAVELGGRTILSGIDFEVSPGEVVGLVGCNGVGKTTLLRLANGALDASEGHVRLGGESVSALSRRRLARGVALVPQDLHVPFPFRVGFSPLGEPSSSVGVFRARRSASFRLLVVFRGSG